MPRVVAEPRYVALAFACLIVALDGFAVAQFAEPLLLKDMPYSVDSVQFSEDGSLAVTGSGSTITVWDAKTGKWQYRIPVRLGGVNNAFLLPGNEQVVAGGRDPHIRIWTIDTITPDVEIPIDVPEYDGAHSLALAPDNKTLAVRTFKNIIHLIDLKTKKVTDVLKIHRGENNPYKHSLGFAPDGKRLASAGGPENEVVVYDLGKKKVVFRVSGDPRDRLAYASWSEDGKILASSSSQHVLFWDGANGDFVWKSQRIRGYINGLAFSPTDNLLAVLSADFIHYLRTDTKELVGGAQHKGVACLAFSPDGKRLITGSKDRFEKNAKIWQVPVQ